jgi:hypothetical protein
MRTKPTHVSRSRNIGLDHGAGKGDKNRTTDTKAFRSNYGDIYFPRERGIFSRRGSKLIKTSQ